MRKYEKSSKGEMASAMKKIIEYMKGSVGIVAVALVLAALGAVLTIIGPDKVGEITDLMADGLMTGIDLSGGKGRNFPWSDIYFKLAFYLYSAVYNGDSHPENVIQNEKRPFKKDKLRSAEVFQLTFTGRYTQPYHK